MNTFMARAAILYASVQISTERYCTKVYFEFVHTNAVMQLCVKSIKNLITVLVSKVVYVYHDNAHV